jgi:hypothetical protein
LAPPPSINSTISKNLLSLWGLVKNPIIWQRGSEFTVQVGLGEELNHMRERKAWSFINHSFNSREYWMNYRGSIDLKCFCYSPTLIIWWIFLFFLILNLVCSIIF